LKQLVSESLYVVEPTVVAEAIVLRAMLRRTVAAPTFRSERSNPQARSFRRDRDARSFRLTGGGPTRAHHR
jgi:hypothetical protein